MTRVHFFQCPVCLCRTGVLLLACMLVLGSTAGIWLTQGAAGLFSDALDALRTPAGGFALVPVLFAPLIFSALAAAIRRPAFFLPLAFWKALIFSYVFTGFLSACGGAGCAFPVLCWYWMRHMDGRGFEIRSFLIALGALAAIGFADLKMISPFLSDILTF